jgi:hypothetical protein
MKAEVQQTIAKEQWNSTAGQIGADWALVNDRLLNAPVFLDMGGYLKTLSTSGLHQTFDLLHDAAEKIVDARQVIDRMLKQQARR